MRTNTKVLLFAYGAIAALTLLIQLSPRLNACEKVASCALNLSKGVAWSVIWPIYWSMSVIGSGNLAKKDDTKIARASGYRIETVAAGLEYPWSLAFLPDGRMLVTERPGRIRIVTKDGKISDPVRGVPKVFAKVEGGVLDVALHPDFASNGLIYISYAESDGDGTGLTVARAKLRDDGGDEPRLDELHVLFRQMLKTTDPRHFGSRLAFSPDGKLFITVGDRHLDEMAQDLSSHLGKVLRINADGSIPEDNPFVGQDGAQPEIWSYGHRNSQGLVFHPVTGKLIETELGPFGGDELNIIEPGKNYGWPTVSWGKHYDGREIPLPPTHPQFVDAIYHWTPAISPSGITYYTSDAIPGWKGNLLIAGLSSASIIRLTLDGETVRSEERIPIGTRIRDVVQGSDGAIYALTDEVEGKILRLTKSN
jgi:glucose/arabinose dehydrogenase